jgi:hypothetical protein
MIEIFPSPLSFTGSYNAAAVEASLQTKWPGTIVRLINGNAFASLETTASYSNIESSAFDVEIWNPATNSYSSTFVYKSGFSALGAGQYYNYSVWGEGVTGVAPNTYTLWNVSATPEFNYVNFGTDEAESRIKVTYNKGNISSIDIGPYSKNFNSKWSRVTGTLNSVEISGIKSNNKLFIQVSSSMGLDASTPLMVFANPISPTPAPGSIVFYVAPGILQAKLFNNTYSSTGFYYPLLPFTATLDQQIDLKTWGLTLSPTNSVLYLDGGSYIDGTFGCRGLSSVKIMGRGVIDAYRKNDWLQAWSYLAEGISDEDKLPYSPFMGFSSFADYGAIYNAKNNTLEGITVVNSITYNNTIYFTDANNVKVINQIPNGDFIKVGEPAEFNNRVNRTARLTNCFGFVGDDCFFPNEVDCDTIVSSCYVIPLYATVFRSYDGKYNGKAYNQPSYGYSAIDVDVRSYASIGYYDKNRPLYSQFKISIFGLWNTQEKEAFGVFDPSFAYYIGDCLFSGIRVEGYCDVPLFDIGVRSYPRTSQDINSVNPYTIDYPEVYGNISGIKFVDITSSSHPYSKYKWVYSNAIFSTEPKFSPNNLTFSNVSIDGKYITEGNKNDFFLWENRPVPLDLESTFYSPANGSSIADIYFLIGDSIAFGVSGFAKDFSSTYYSGVFTSGEAVPGCYIWRLTQPPGEVTGGPGFYPLKPGKSTGNVESTFVDPYGDTGLETVLAHKLRNDSGDRDIYFIKIGVGGSMPVSAVSADGYAAENWSTSSAGSLFYEFMASATSAIGWIRNQNKYPNLKGGVICLGTNRPEYVANQAFASSMIIKETSSLIAGVRSIFASSTGNGLNVDTFYTNIVWAGPLELGSTGTATRNYYERFNDRLQDLDLSSIRFNYLPTPSAAEYLADSVHYNIKGYSKIAEDIYSIFKHNTSSVTDPTLNPQGNLKFFANGARVLETYNPRKPVRKSTKYKVEVNDGIQYNPAHVFGRSRSAVAAYSSQNPGGPAATKLWLSGANPEMSFLTFGASSTSNIVKIEKIGDSISTIQIRPKSKNISYEVTGGKAYVTLNPLDQIWVTVNNEVSSPLFLFCDPLKPPVPQSKCLYFPPGTTYLSSLPGPHISKDFTTTAGTTLHRLYGVGFSSINQYGYTPGEDFTLYFDGGAYVVGSLDLRNRHNIKLLGPGVLSLENIPKESAGDPRLSYIENYNYVQERDSGQIPIHFNLEFDEVTVGGIVSGSKAPSGNYLNGLTIVDTPFHGVKGINGIENFKLISPWVPNTDGFATSPDHSVQDNFQYAKHCFLFCADDTLYLPFNASTFNKDFLWLGGKVHISSIVAYTVNNTPLANYSPRFYFNQVSKSHPAVIEDIDLGSYAYARPDIEVGLRLTVDGSSMQDSTVLDPVNYGIYDITLKNIRFEDEIENELFWLGNVPDPFGNNPLVVDRGNEFGAMSGIVIDGVSANGSPTNTRIYQNRIWGKDASSRPYNITFKNIFINGQYVTSANKDSYISWASATNPTFTDPDAYNSNILFVFDYVPEQGYQTNKGVRVDYLWDRGQLHPFVATLHYIQEQAKVMQASAYYDDNLSEVAASGWWRNLLHNYANTLTESSGAFPNSFDNYTTYKFGRDFQKLYYDYTHNFKRHKAVPTTIELDGPTIFGHTFGSVLYNSDLSKNSSLTTQYPEYITSSLTNVYEFKAGSVLFSTSGSSSGTYVASSITDCYVEVSELRNSGILSHIEFSHTSGTSVNNSFAVIRLNKADRLGYRYNPLNYENTLIKHKGAPGGFSRVIFDISKYSTDSNLGYDVSTNFLSPEHDFKLNFKTIIANNKGEIFGGSPVGIWIHTKPELGKIWSFTDGGRWVQHSVSSLTKSEVVDHYSHIFELPTEQRDLESSSIRCNRFRLIGNKNQENDVIASLSESEFTDIEVNFNTKNYACRGEKIDVPEEYFSNVAQQVHRLGQKYVIEVFSLDRDLDKFTLFYDFNLVDSTLNKWSKPFVLGKGSTGLPVGDLYCKEYRVDLTPRHLYNIIRYFNEIAGGATSVGYASRNENQTSGIYESRGGSRINYVENPNWNPNTKSAQGQLINEVTIKN